MAVAMWIRENMLDTSDQIERPLTEAELKVQRSLQKLSIPEWYLNKRSVPPKILSNAAPIESRPSSWKNSPIKKKTQDDPKVFSRHPSGGYKSAGKIDNKFNVAQSKASSTNVQTKVNNFQPILSSNSNIYQIPRKMESWLENKENSAKNAINYPTFNVRPRRVYISKTFPKVSPSRKIQNINLVFTQRVKKLEISDGLLNDARNESRFVDSRMKDSTRENYDEENRSIREKKMREEKKPGEMFSSSEDISAIMKTPDPKNRFKIPAVSTPDGSPVSIFASISEKDGKFKGRLPSWYVRTRAFFEGLTNSSGAKKPSIESKSRVKVESKLAAENSRKIAGRASYAKVLNFDEKENRCSSTDDEDDYAAEKFFNSRNKSMELENIVKNSSQLRNRKTLIQDRIETFSKKRESSPRRRSTISIQKGVQNYVKKLVNALEHGRKGEDHAIRGNEESGNESDVKSGTSGSSSTTISMKDSSDSDSDPQSPSLPSSGSDSFHYEMDFDTGKSTPEVKTLAKEEKMHNEEVHWIKIPKTRRMPRTSSLLSVISRPPTVTENSPCVSPIKCVNEIPQTLGTGVWGQTYRKSNNPYNQLFRIDETVITDSGYSERSDWSGASSSGSMADVSWSTQNSGYNHHMRVQISRSVVC